MFDNQQMIGNAEKNTMNFSSHQFAQSAQRSLDKIVPYCRENSRVQQVLLFVFAFYAFSNLISMAVMSLGAVALVFVLASVVLRSFWVGSSPRENSSLKSQLSKSELSFGVADFMYLKLSLAFALVCFGSLVAAKSFPLYFEGHSVSVRLFKDSLKLWYLFWPLVIAFGLQLLTDVNRARVVKVVFYTFLILCAVGIIQHYTGWPRKQHIPESPAYHHAVLFIGHHLSVSSIFIFPWFIFLNRAWNRRFGGNPTQAKRDYKMLFFVLAGAVLLFFTYSRMLWISWPLGCALFVVLKLSRKSRLKVIFCAILVFIAFAMIPDVRMRFVSNQGISERESIWRNNLVLFKRRPLLGVGWQHSIDHLSFYKKYELKDAKFFAGHSHNNFLEALVTTGGVGAFIWLLWWMYIFNLAWKSRRFEKNSDYVSGSGLFSALVVFQLNGLTQVNFGDAKVLHQLMWIIGWMLFEQRQRNMQNETKKIEGHS